MQLRGGRASIHTQTDWSNGGRLNDWATRVLDTAQGEDLAWGSDTWVQVSLAFWGIWLNLFKLCVLLGKRISRETLKASYKIKIHDFTFEKNVEANLSSLLGGKPLPDSQEEQREMREVPRSSL